MIEFGIFFTNSMLKMANQGKKVVKVVKYLVQTFHRVQNTTAQKGQGLSAETIVPKMKMEIAKIFNPNKENKRAKR